MLKFHMSTFIGGLYDKMIVSNPIKECVSWCRAYSLHVHCDIVRNAYLEELFDHIVFQSMYIQGFHHIIIISSSK